MVVAIGVVVGAATAAGGFFNLARIVFVGDIVDEARLGRASGLLQAATAGASIVGPSVAAPLLVTAGATWALALNAVSFLVSYVLVRSVRPERAPEGAAAEPPAAAGADPPAGLVREFTAALALFRRNRVLAALLVTTSLVMLGGGAATALDVYFFRENLHATPAMFGLAGAAFGVGALVGSAVGGVFGDRLGHARVFRAGALLAAGFFLVYSRLNAVGPAIAAIALFSVGLGAASTVAMPLTMRAVPRSHLARVVSVFGPVNQAANVLSLALAGALVGLMPQGFRTTLMGVGFGRVDLVFFGSAVLMLAGVAYAAVALRGADRVPAAAPEPAPAAVDTGSIAHRPTLDRSDSQV
jgi:predicted MFS family arabinose efflux permease